MSLKTEAPADRELLLNDLGPLAWVLEELRKSLDFSNKALRRFVREADLARGTELTEIDASQLRVARQHLHQAVGALEMIGLPTPAALLRAMEAVVQKYVVHPERCNEAAAVVMDRAGIALTEFLEGVLKGKHASPVALFPQYRTVQELAGADRIHPADLWPVTWRWEAVNLPGKVGPLPYAPEVRSHLDRTVLNVVKTSDKKSALLTGRVALGLSVGQKSLKPATFWAVTAAYFEALGQGLVPVDIYTRRTASRVLQQYALLAKGETNPSDRLAQDLLFYCWQAAIPENLAVPVLQAVRTAYGFAQHKPVNYTQEQFGRFDPSQLAQARKRIASAAETWSALAGGDVNRLKVVAEQFAAVAESIVKLHPESQALAQALQTTVDSIVRSGAGPSAEIAMEVATSVLYLEASYEDLDPTDNHLAERGTRLAQRLQHVRTGGDPEPLEGWMEDLYRRVSERQTMGSVVDELRASLAEVEKALDQYFRDANDQAALRDVPGRLAQMRGVFSVLGLDQPSIAAQRMRASVENFLIDNRPHDAAHFATFEKLGNSLGAMALLIDMLSYQRAMAKKLFVYDETLGELKPLMGRGRAEPANPPTPPTTTSDSLAPSERSAPTAPAPLSPSAPSAPSATSVPSVPSAPTMPAAAGAGSVTSVAAKSAVSTKPAALAVDDEDDEDDDGDLRDIFLEEAREVVHNGLAAARELASDPSNLAEQTTLRRAFHTLKGSARMVGLTEFGEAGWAFEQLMNAWLAEQKPASDALITLASHAMQAFGLWVDDVASDQAADWSSAPFRQSADALRLHAQLVPLRLPEPHKHVMQATGSVVESGAEPVVTSAPQLVPSLISEPAAGHEDFKSTQPERDDHALDAPDSVSATDGPDTLISMAPELAFPDFESTQIQRIDPEPLSPELLSPELLVPPMSDFEATRIQNYALGADAHDAQAQAPLDTGFGLDDLDFSVPVPTVHGDAPDEVALEQSLAETSAPAPLVLDFPPVAANDVHTDLELDASTEDDDPVKVIGNLRLSIPFYNVYLNEADEWSRRLQTELGEWALETHHPIPASVVGLAHSLAGSSATVGFASLAHEARLLEHALDHLRLHEQGDVGHAALFNRSAEDIRRLLHQFAAGFLKEADAAIEHELQAIVDTDFPPAPERAPVDEGEEAAVDLADNLDAEAELDANTDTVDGADPVGEEVPAEVAVESAATEAPSIGGVSVVPPPLRVARGLDDELDAQDRLDPDLFPYFQEEAQELMPALGTALRQWVGHPEQAASRRDVLRVLHTLKGSARLAGAMRLGEMAHRMESGIEELGSDGLQSVQLEPLLASFDALQTAFDSLSGPHATAQQSPVEVSTLEPEPTAPAGLGTPGSSIATALAVSSARSSSSTAAPIPQRAVASQSVRVRSQLLDRLVNQAGEVMISRSSMEGHVAEMTGSLTELRGNLDRLRGQLRDIELQAESQMQSRLAQTKETTAFDPLEFDRFTRVQELTRMMAESVNDVATVQRNLQRIVESTEDDLVAQGRQARELQRDLLRTRMVEFEMISDRLYGVVRQAGKEAGKQVRLDIEGGSFEMDRGVLDRMTPAFEHILRNAVSHGIERSEERVKAGKAAVGNITIRIHQEGNDVSVSFQDDGGGLRLDKIRAKAIANKLIRPDEQLTDAAAANLLFMPGFSTAETVTELSGRGIGMDVVLSELNALGGRVETTTEPGKGTTFRLVLPLTTAVTQVVMLRIGNFVMGVPSNLMEVVLRVPLELVEKAYQRNMYAHGGEELPFYWAGALLQVSSASQDGAAKNLPVAVFRSAGQRIVMHLDEVLGNREVVVKNLGPQLSRLPGLAGMSVLASGAVVLIYNPVALSTVYGEQARALQSEKANKAGALQGAVGATDNLHSAMAEPEADRTPLVMVVDDSITVRRVTQRLLKREGYRVVLANDGLQALEKLRDERPTLVLSDIEMPRMDGFDLVRTIRSDAALRNLPVIMITSRIAQKHRDLAAELGVDHYLGKPFAEDVLLGLIRDYCAAAEPT